MKLILVVGARPNLMKIAPIIRELKKESRRVEWKIVHTGQHYDYEMSKVFFEEFEIPEPDHFLGVGSGSHAEQTAKIMIMFEKVCLQENPDVVVVVGDVNSTLASSITAKKLNVNVAHVEAGLRSRDMSMPEEINRIVTDSISDYLFVTERSGIDNLRKEGKSLDQIFFVGNVMVDNLFYQLERLDGCFFESEALKKKLVRYFFVTLHRPSNVDNYCVFERIVNSLNEISEEIPMIFPIHPRTRDRLNSFGFKLSENIVAMSPLSFSESLCLWKDALAVLTDSGGLQEETTALGVPCLTLRQNTERPITVEIGTNTLIGSDLGELKNAISNILRNEYKKGRIPERWDGKAAQRIVQILYEYEKRQ